MAIQLQDDGITCAEPVSRWTGLGQRDGLARTGAR